jgi:hypothetical protein
VSRRLSVIALFFLLGCASPHVRGGRLVDPGAPTPGRAVSTYQPSDCRDSRGEPVHLEEGARITRFETTGGREVLVERRAGFDALVIDNGRPSPEGWSFAVTLESREQSAILREYRFPATLGQAGRVVVARDFEVTDTKDGFIGRNVNALVLCTLSPDVAEAPALPSAEPSSIVSPP